MNTIIEKVTGLDKMTDQVIATDFLVSTKSGIQQFAVAITETISADLRAVLINQLDAMIIAHEQISDYMMKRGFYQAYNLKEQYLIDRKVTDTALNLKNIMG